VPDPADFGHYIHSISQSIIRLLNKKSGSGIPGFFIIGDDKERDLPLSAPLSSFQRKAPETAVRSSRPRILAPLGNNESITSFLNFVNTFRKQFLRIQRVFLSFPITLSAKYPYFKNLPCTFHQTTTEYIHLFLNLPRRRFTFPSSFTQKA
jgi:hypothetical protein